MYPECILFQTVGIYVPINCMWFFHQGTYSVVYMKRKIEDGINCDSHAIEIYEMSAVKWLVNIVELDKLMNEIWKELYTEEPEHCRCFALSSLVSTDFRTLLNECWKQRVFAKIFIILCYRMSHSFKLHLGIC